MSMMLCMHPADARVDRGLLLGFERDLLQSGRYKFLLGARQRAGRLRRPVEREWVRLQPVDVRTSQLLPIMMKGRVAQVLHPESRLGGGVLVGHPALSRCFYIILLCRKKGGRLCKRLGEAVWGQVPDVRWAGDGIG